MFKKILLLIVFFSFLISKAQVGINTTHIDNSVIFEIDSDDSGILIPRINLNSITDNTTVAAPITNGTLIYNLTNNATLQEGFYFWKTNTWVLINDGTDNVYSTDGTLNANRTINTGTSTFRLSGGAEHNALTIQRTDNTLERGLSFQNSGNYYDATIFMESGTGQGLVFATGSNVSDPTTLSTSGRTLTLQDDQSITFDAYGTGTFTGTSTKNLTVDTNGNVIEQPINRGVQFYSYDITSQASPDINTLRTETKISLSGEYTGNLNSSAITQMDPSADSEGFVIKIVGTYEVKNSGEFNFTEISDDGARIYIDGSLILDYWEDDGGTQSQASVILAKGKHKFEFWYYENAGGQSFEFSWGTNPDSNSGVIDATQFTIE